MQSNSGFDELVEEDNGVIQADCGSLGGDDLAEPPLPDPIPTLPTTNVVYRAAPPAVARATVAMATAATTVPAPSLTSPDLAFPYRLFNLLRDAEQYNFIDIVSWVRNGTAFQIHNEERFVRDVLPQHFPNMSKLKSLQRQLSAYSFTTIRAGRYDVAYCNEFFLRHDEPKLIYIKRKPTPKRTKSKSAVAAATSAPQEGTQAFIAGLDATTSATATAAASAPVRGTVLGGTSASVPPFQSSYLMMQAHRTTGQQQGVALDPSLWFGAPAVVRGNSSSGNTLNDVNSTLASFGSSLVDHPLPFPENPTLQPNEEKNDPSTEAFKKSS